MSVLCKDGCFRDIRPMNGERFTEIELRSYVDGEPEIIVLNSKQALVVGRDAKTRGKLINRIATYWLREISNDYVCGPVCLVERNLL